MVHGGEFLTNLLPRRVASRIRVMPFCASQVEISLRSMSYVQIGSEAMEVVAPRALQRAPELKKRALVMQHETAGLSFMLKAVLGGHLPP